MALITPELNMGKYSCEEIFVHFFSKNLMKKISMRLFVASVSFDDKKPIFGSFEYRTTYTPVTPVASSGYSLAAQMYSNPVGARTGYEQTYQQTPQTTAASSYAYNARPQVWLKTAF